jgi:hypothetical protein
VLGVAEKRRLEMRLQRDAVARQRIRLRGRVSGTCTAHQSGYWSEFWFPKFQFEKCRNPRIARSLLLRLASAKVFQIPVLTYFVNRRFTPVKGQQRISLLARFAEVLSFPAGIFKGNDPK